VKAEPKLEGNWSDTKRGDDLMKLTTSAYMQRLENSAGFLIHADTIRMNYE